MAATTYRDYDAFAGAYDRHWGFFADRVLPTLDRLGLENIPSGAHVIDLCCGTGVLARSLIDRFRVTGIDGSPAMIAIARQRVPDAEFVVADARSFVLEDPAAAVVSTFDSLNHVLSIDEVLDVFRNVRTVLDAGGIFIFDLNMDRGYRERWTDTTVVDERDVIVGRGSWDEDSRIATFEFTLVERCDDGSLVRSDLALTQRCYRPEEITDALHATGFDDVKLFDGMDDLGFGGVGRAFFIGR